MTFSWYKRTSAGRTVVRREVERTDFFNAELSIVVDEEEAARADWKQSPNIWRQLT
jgi:hypothetical protein